MVFDVITTIFKFLLFEFFVLFEASFRSFHPELEGERKVVLLVG